MSKEPTHLDTMEASIKRLVALTVLHDGLVQTRAHLFEALATVTPDAGRAEEYRVEARKARESGRP